MESQEVEEKIKTLAKWGGGKSKHCLFWRSWGFDGKWDPRLSQYRWPLSPKV